MSMTFTFKPVFVSLAIVVMLNNVAFAQRAPKMAWEQCYGGSGLENSRQFIQPHDHMMVHTSDGGFAFVAITNSYDAPVTGNHHDTTANATFDFWLVKIDAYGKMQWERCFGGSSDESPRCLIQTSDGGYAMCGTTRSHDGDVIDSHPIGSNDELLYVNDAWIVKTDAAGQKQWAHAYGTTHGDEYFNSMIEVPDGYIAIGLSTTVENAPEGHVLDSKLNQGDAMVVKLDFKGIQQWSQLYGGVIGDEGFAILACPSGGYIFAGEFGVANGTVSFFAVPWVVRLDTDGTMIWQKIYTREPKLFQETTMGSMIKIPTGYLISGSPHGFVFTIDTAGTILSEQDFGSAPEDMINSVTQMPDGNFVFAGSTRSPNVPGIHILEDQDTVLHNTDSTDGWVGCFSPNLKLIWQKAMGGDFRDCFYTVLSTQEQETGETALILYGAAESGNQHDGGNGDHPGMVHGYADAWVVKLAPSSRVSEQTTQSGFNAYPNPATSDVFLNLLDHATVSKVQFFDVLGTEVFPLYRVEGTRIVTNVQQLPAGIYEISASYTNGEQQLQKFVHSSF